MTAKSPRLLSLAMMTALSMTIPVSAQDNESKFSKIDDFLSEQAAAKKTPPSETISHADANTDDTDNNDVVPLSDVQQEVIEVADVHVEESAPELLVPVTALPPLSQFLFKEDLYLTSNKLGKLFNADGEVFDIDKNATETDIAMLLASQTSDSCALISSNSNVMMRGENSSRAQTYLEVQSVSLSSFNYNDEDNMVYNFSFKKKLPLNDSNGKSGISISILCDVPDVYKDTPQDMKLADVNTAFQSLFDFKIAMYIEI